VILPSVLLMVSLLQGGAVDDASSCVGNSGLGDSTVQAGSEVKLCWSTQDVEDVGNPQNGGVFKYFRLRRSQTPEGSWDVIVSKLMRDQCFEQDDVIYGSYKYVADRTYHFYVTAIYELTDEGGVKRLSETPGSQHARVTVKQ